MLPFMLSAKDVSLNRGVCTKALGLLDLVSVFPCMRLTWPVCICSAAQLRALSNMKRPLPVLSVLLYVYCGCSPECCAPSDVPQVQHRARCLPTPGAAGCAWLEGLLE